MMKVGYVRVSTEGQNPDRQIDALLKQGIDRRNIYMEKSAVQNEIALSLTGCSQNCRQAIQ